MEFKDRLIEYLKAEKDLCESEIEAHKLLSIEEKEEIGLVIRDAKASYFTEPSNEDLSSTSNSESKFCFTENKTKIRIGDKVYIYPSESEKPKSDTYTVLEISTDYIIIEASNDAFANGSLWNIEVAEASMFDTYISILESMDESSPGVHFLKQLSGEINPSDESLFGPDPKAIKLAENLNEELNDNQLDAVYYSVKQPSLRLIQGPPGTGKTHVLSCIASIMSTIGNEVAIVAKTHQAVNNALNAIYKRSPNLNILKIGQEYRSEGLNDSILNFAKYQDYLSWRKRCKGRKTADIVGMTLQAATVNMCMRNSGFKPQLVLVDEASQIPLAEASIIGASGAGSVIFIGDDRQMPPIFVEDLENDPLSISIFEHIAITHPQVKDVLNITYRMNEEICGEISKNYYEPHKIHLISGESAASRRMSLDVSSQPDERFETIFGKESYSIVSLNVSKENSCQDENHEEALFAAQIAAIAMNEGIDNKDIAIVTPFRKQVNAVRAAFKHLRWDVDDCPIVDTVERLQGQDVRLIIVSLAVTDKEYYNKVRKFLLNPNRLNVMISRAKEKVVILKSDFIQLK